MKLSDTIAGLFFCCLLMASEPTFAQTASTSEDTMGTTQMEANADTVKGSDEELEGITPGTPSIIEPDKANEAPTSPVSEVSQTTKAEAGQSNFVESTPVFSWGGVALVAAAFLAAGYLLGWLVHGRRPEATQTNAKGEIASPDKTASEQQVVWVNEASITNAPVAAEPLVASPTVAVKDPMAGFLSGWRLQIERLQGVASGVSSETEVKDILDRIIDGRGPGSSGLGTLLTHWETAFQSGNLNRQHLIKDFARRESQKNLAWLYRISAAADIAPLREHFTSLSIPVEELKDIREKFFSLVGEYSGLSFTLPQFGSSYTEEKFDLVPDNINALGGMDRGTLLNSLKNWTTGTKRPIIDVGTLGLEGTRTEMSAELRQKFSTRTSVAYYVNN